MIILRLGLIIISLRPSLAQDGPFMEIEFEPVQGPAMFDGDVIPLDATDGSVARPGPFRANPGGPTTKGSGNQTHQQHPASREEDLDQMMQSLLREAPEISAIMSTQGAFGPARSRSAARKPMDTALTRRPAMDQEVILQGLPADLQRSSMPIGLFRDLFPGPLIMDQGHSARRATPFADPDPLVMDMLQAMNSNIQDALLPLIHDANKARTAAPPSCDRDVQKHCGKERSQVHCLGQHQDDISDSCRKDIGQSVPFRCSHAIDKFCDVLQVGVLDCLSGHLEDLDAPCKDSVVATRHVIAKVNTQKATVKEGETKNGVKTIHTLPRTLSLLSGAAAGGKPGSTASNAIADVEMPVPEKVVNAKVLDSAAALIAEAEEAAKQRQQQLGQHAESWSTTWKILALGFCAALVYIAMNFTDSSRRVSSMLKPYMSTEGASSTPLTGGLCELPKPV